MKTWLYVLGGCLLGLLVKKKVDERNVPDDIRDWPPGLKYNGKEAKKTRWADNTAVDGAGTNEK